MSRGNRRFLVRVGTYLRRFSVSLCGYFCRAVAQAHSAACRMMVRGRLFDAPFARASRRAVHGRSWQRSRTLSPIITEPGVVVQDGNGPVEATGKASPASSHSMRVFILLLLDRFVIFCPSRSALRGRHGASERVYKLAVLTWDCSSAKACAALARMMRRTFCVSRPPNRERYDQVLTREFAIFFNMSNFVAPS